MLTLDGVHTFYAKSHILHGVSLEVRPGEVVGLLGRNGVGKSTTLKTIMGLVHAVGRHDHVRGQGHRRRRALPARAHGHRLRAGGPAHLQAALGAREPPHRASTAPRSPPARREALLQKVYASFPILKDRRDQAGGTLSGGEQQMLAIARAMMLEPRIILLDEPTEGLDAAHGRQIRQIIEVLHKEGVAILLVEQNVPLTLGVSDRCYIMEKGVVRHHAPAADLRADATVIHQYLGV